MTNFVSQLTSFNAVGVLVTLVVFFVVVFLVVRQSINFGMTLTLLAFSLVVGFVIANYDIARNRVDSDVFPKILTEIQEVKVTTAEILQQLKAVEDVGVEDDAQPESVPLLELPTAVE